MITFTYPTSKSNKLLLSGVPWQEPVITEKLASDILPNRHVPTYLAIPWATLIDWSLNGNNKNKNIAHLAIAKIKTIEKHEYVTVCQHYRYRTILPLLKSIGCRALFTPHVIDDDHFGLDVQPYPLYAANVPDVINERKIFYSFVGAYMKHYISDIRDTIFQDTHPSDAIIVKREKWQFNNEVYNEQVTGKTTTKYEEYLSSQYKVYYNNVLKNSRFSLCPSGAGPSSIRIYESLACGAIPVILADTLQLPKLKGVDWSDCVIRIPERKYYDMRKILNSISPELEEKMRRNCLSVYKRVSGSSINDCLTTYFE